MSGDLYGGGGLGLLGSTLITCWGPGLECLKSEAGLKTSGGATSCGLSRELGLLPAWRWGSKKACADSKGLEKAYGMTGRCSLL